MFKITIQKQTEQEKTSKKLLLVSLQDMGIFRPGPPLVLPTISTYKVASSAAGQKKACPECGKTFSSMCGYRIHINSHRGIYPFKCDVCNKGFTTARARKEHLTHHTNICYFACAVCSETFPTEYRMKMHVSVEHKTL